MLTANSTLPRRNQRYHPPIFLSGADPFVVARDERKQFVAQDVAAPATVVDVVAGVGDDWRLAEG